MVVNEKMATAAAATTSQNTDAKVQQIPDSAKDINGISSKDLDSLMSEYESLPNKQDQEQSDIPFFVAKSANDTLVEASSQEPPKPLWLSLWYEGQICCFFANSGVGKSIYAVQIAAEIAKQRKVLYFDFELSSQQFAARYSDGIWNNYKFPDNFKRVEVNADYLATNGMPNVIEQIEAFTLKEQADVIIIDNITWVTTGMEKGDDAGRIMQQFMKLKKVYGWSILILAHTPKREKMMPITENDLAGSRVFFNFVDSAFSIGQSLRGDDFRYVIEIKTRMGAKTYGKNHVIVTQIVKEDYLTYHKPIGYSTEDLEIGSCQHRKNKPDGDDGMRTVFEKILNNGSMRYTDLVAEFISQVKKTNGESYGKDSAKKKIGKAIKDGVLVLTNDGNYKVSVKV